MVSRMYEESISVSSLEIFGICKNRLQGTFFDDASSFSRAIGHIYEDVL